MLWKIRQLILLNMILVYIGLKLYSCVHYYSSEVPNEANVKIIINLDQIIRQAKFDSLQFDKLI
jgi:hypothetical protein